MELTSLIGGLFHIQNHKTPQKIKNPTPSLHPDNDVEAEGNTVEWECSDNYHNHDTCRE